MEEAVAQIVACYEAMHTGEGAMEAMATLDMIYRQGETIDVLFHILNTRTEPLVAQYAIVGLERCLKNSNYEHMTLEHRAVIFQALLPLMLHRESYVRKYVRDTVNSLLLDEFVPQIYSFIQESMTSDNVWHLHTALYLGTMCIPYAMCHGDLGTLIEAGKAMIERATQCAIIDVNVAAACHALNIAVHFDDEDPSGAAYLGYALSLITRLISEFPVDNPQNQFAVLEFITDICKVLKVVIDQTLPWVNAPELLGFTLEILSSPIDRRIKMPIHEVSDIILTTYSEDIITNEEVVRSMLTVYFGLAVESFQAEDPFDLSEHNVFSVLGRVFADSNEILELILSMVPELFDTPEGRYSIITLLYYLFENDADFFQDKIKPIGELLAQGLEDEAYCTREAAAYAVMKFAENQGSEIVSVANDLMIVLFRVMSVDMSAVLIRAVTTIVRNIYEDVGPIFNDLLDEVAKYLEAPDPALVVAAFQCISELVHKSPKRARLRFADIFGVMEKPFQQDGEMDEVKPYAVYCMSGLLKASKKLFIPHAEGFLTLVVRCFSSPDTTLVHESIIAFGEILQNIPEVAAPIAEEVLGGLMEIASKIKDLHVELDDEDMLGVDGDNEMEQTELERTLNVISAAIRIMCCTLSIYPGLLGSYIGQATEVIQGAVERHVTDCEVACAKGAVFLFEGLRKIGLTDDVKSYVVDLVALLTTITESENAGIEGAGEAFTAIADIIAVEEQTGFVLCTGSIDGILKSVYDVFTGERMYMSGTLTFYEELHVPAQRILREIMASIGPKAVPIVQEFIPLMNELITFNKNAMKDLALEFFGDLVYWCGEAVPDDLKVNTFILAMDAVTTRASAYGFAIFKQLAEKVPEVITPSLEAVLNVIKERLSIDEASEPVMTAQDNCVSALYMISKFMGEQFPLPDFLMPVLAHMPPQVLTEEYNDSIDFLKLIMSAVPQGECVAEFATVLVKLFADDVEADETYSISEENLMWGRQTLAAIMSTMEDAQQFIFDVCEGDEFKCEAVVEAMSL